MRSLGLTEVTEAESSKLIVTRILNGDKQAENEMVERYGRGLLFALKHRSKNKSLAEDVAQETWRIVLEKVRAGKLKDSTKLAAYIIQTGKYQLIMKYRSVKNINTTSDVDLSQTADPAQQPLQLIERHNITLVVRKLVSELKTPRDKEIIMRFYLNEEKKQHICKDFGLSELHFNRVLFRARQRFKQIWIEYVGTKL